MSLSRPSIGPFLRTSTSKGLSTGCSWRNAWLTSLVLAAALLWSYAAAASEPIPPLLQGVSYHKVADEKLSKIYGSFLGGAGAVPSAALSASPPQAQPMVASPPQYGLHINVGRGVVSVMLK